MRRNLLVFITALSASLSFFCSENEDSSPADIHLRLDVQDNKVPDKAGSFEVYVTSNTSWTMEAQSGWIHPERTSGKGNLSVRINYDKNGTGSAKRTGAVMLKAEGVKPVQFIITQSSLLFANPIFQMPDPYVVKDGKTYWA